jgi:hypothetical protein
MISRINCGTPNLSKKKNQGDNDDKPILCHFDEVMFFSVIPIQKNKKTDNL